MRAMRTTGMQVQMLKTRMTFDMDMYINWAREDERVVAIQCMGNKDVC